MPPSVLPALRNRRRVVLMGILNITPDSFSDGGDSLDPQAAVRRALEMQAEGAGLIDVGGESTRPGSARVDEHEEWRRIAPVVDLLSGARLTVPLSIDTRNPGVAARALATGVSVINHVAVEGETDRVRAMAELARDSRVHPGAELIVMHVRGYLETMHTLPPMVDPVRETLEGLRKLRDIALDAGIPQDRLLLDPGIGFGKNGDENYALLRDLAAFHELGCRLVVGPSRKRFLGARDPADRDFATAAAVMAAISAGCDVVRVHNVRAMAQVVRVVEALGARTSVA